MAGNGPPPKENRRRRNADTYADVKTTVSASAVQLRGPTLAEAIGGLLDDDEPAIVALVSNWWDTWRRSPLAEAFLETDWSRLTMLAPLVAVYYRRPHHMVLAEIRQSESLLGATHVDRLKARIKVEREPEVKELPAGVAALDQYRRDLAG